jgi:hypothetical protein
MVSQITQEDTMDCYLPFHIQVPAPLRASMPALSPGRPAWA